METYTLPEELTFRTSPGTYDSLMRLLKKGGLTELTLDFSRVKQIDSAGATILFLLEKFAKENNINLHKVHISDEVQRTIELFKLDHIPVEQKKEEISYFESIGEKVYSIYRHFINFSLLFYEVFSFSLYASFARRKLRRQGEVMRQALEIGASALPIVALISFLVGFILALQSAAQLRQFGADIYVVDLVVISMVSEMGPLMTAILVAGRSGSAIAAEISSMVISEETDALKVMDIDPVPYLIVPKVYAIALVMPMLTIFAISLGILGGIAISFLYLGISPVQFFGEAIQVVFLKDIMVAVIKSLSFAMLIVITGSYFGFNAKGGAVGIGKAATSSVVASIFLVIVADSILGLIFYFPN
jgi:phospholipid/cholesterol/gamma-HCH transport system permease protein